MAVPRCLLRRLYLNDNAMGDMGCLALAMALALRPAGLDRLGVSNNSIGDKGGLAFLDVLSRPNGSTLEKLCASDNRYRDVM